MEIEIILNANSIIDEHAVSCMAKSFLVTYNWNIENLMASLMKFQLLQDNVEKIRIAQLPDPCELNMVKIASDCKIYVYKLSESGFAMGDELDEEETDSTPPTVERILPSRDFDGIWENLIFDNEIKDQLMSYASMILRFGQRGIDPNIINCGRLILLHGPPGTGKTSLCQALAQKISITFRSQYSAAYYIEINSHSLFSKWFSESGKMVMKLFKKILDIVQMPNTLVCLLMDEVESLTMSRQNLAQDPSDSIRVVNAVLTQLDLLRRYGNVLILTTSNIPDKIDHAFRDRADLKVYVGPPGGAAIYKILSGCVAELKRTGILLDEGLTDADEILLNEICGLCEGLSGRILRKLPLIALSVYLPSYIKKNEEKVTLSNYLLALKESSKFQKRTENDI